ncbi:hypothetical protein NPIL_410601 [Nephila pilipes]|uniref:Uncharacterized protein n=1 Tax=Nephila pilipes TaxID=299642 RepID=A0A8X6QVV4_NEPPI|nr:hypothetical protein NPIL_410601 [Nephila pilipes]
METLRTITCVSKEISVVSRLQMERYLSQPTKRAYKTIEKGYVSVAHGMAPETDITQFKRRNSDPSSDNLTTFQKSHFGNHCQVQLQICENFPRLREFY